MFKKNMKKLWLGQDRINHLALESVNCLKSRLEKQERINDTFHRRLYDLEEKLAKNKSNSKRTKLNRRK